MVFYSRYFVWFITIIGILSNIALVTTSIILLVVARRAGSRHGETVRWEGVITVLLTVGIYFLSSLPFSVVFGGMFMGLQYSNTTLRAVLKLQNLNVMANFFIYSLTVRSFRRFFKTKLLTMIRSCTQQRTRPRGRQRPLQKPHPHYKPNPKQTLQSRQDLF